MDGNGAAAPTPAIELVNVSKRYGDTVALDDVSITISQKELVVLLGPSGCGKSTLLQVIAGLEDVTAGEVYIDGRLANYVVPKKRDVAMVFQNYALYPHMTVAKNIGFPLKMTGHSKDDVRQRVAEVVHLLEMEPELERYPEQLSGGQRQRVALGRAIIRNPTAFLMDEPLSNLDALLRTQMRDELLKLHRRVGRTTVYVTHDQMEAMTMADRIAVLHSGVVQQIGTPRQIYREPANTFVATFVGSPQMNLFTGRAARRGAAVRFESPTLNVPLAEHELGLEAEQEITIGARPEDIMLTEATDPAVVTGTVTLVEPVGADVFLNVALNPDAACVVRVPAATELAEGQPVNLRLPDRLHVFGRDGARIVAADDLPDAHVRMERTSYERDGRHGSKSK
jgi:ABC-type sugar transport system ATPase subunit